MKTFFNLPFLLLLTSLLAQNCFAQFTEGNKYVDTTLLSDSSSIIYQDDPAAPVTQLGLHFKIDRGWHIYWKNSGESAIPTKIKWTTPSGWSIGEIKWPTPYRFLERGDITTYGYKDQVLLIADLYAPAEIPSRKELIKVEALVSFLVCSDVCIPGEKKLELELPFGPEEVQGTSKDFDLFSKYSQQTPESSANSGLEAKLLQGVKLYSEENGKFIVVAVELDHKRFSNSNPISDSLQLFPYHADNLKFISSSVINRNDQLAVVAKYKVDKVQPLATTGTIAIDGDALVDLPELAKTAISVKWRAEQFEPNKLPDLPSELQPSEGQDLLFRFVSYKQSESVRFAQSVPAFDTNSLLFALIFGFLAGIILNFMPCVLPIISIKVMSFISHADRPRSYVITSAIAYSFGILATFLALALTVLSLRGVGTQLGWGFQFQYPQFIIALSLIVFVLALGFFDLFHFTIPHLQKANRGVSKLGEGHARTFFDGVLATLLSTPCTAPFLGTALAFSFSAPAPAVVAVFLAIGLGLAFPYILLSLNKRLISYLPKPGDWMYRVRELMGFFLLATVIWLLYVLSKLTADGAIWLLLLLLLIFVGFWFSKRVKNENKALVRIFFSVCVLFGSWYLWPRLTSPAGQEFGRQNSKIDWLEYSPSTVIQNLEAGRTVFIDFTAEWCITCKANEKLVIASDPVVKAIEELDVVAIKADWTSGDPIVSEALSNYGGNGVPYYVVLSKNREIVLPTLLTPSLLINAFKEAQTSD